MRRSSRACVRCRRHKAKCILERSGHVLEPPCQKCVQAGVECVLATSNRGGLRRRKTDLPSNLEPTEITDTDTSFVESAGISRLVHDTLHSNPSPGLNQSGRVYSSQPAIIEDAFTSADLHGTSDALNILSQLADYARPDCGQLGQYQTEQSSNSLLEFPLVKSGQLTPMDVAELVERYATIYHPFYPIAPVGALNRRLIGDTARDAPHLLTAMITIAASNTTRRGHVAEACARSMRSLLAELGSGKRCGIEAVEAMLLIAEWEPEHLLPDSTKVSCGQEDMAAWLHIGTAIRIAQALKLDRTVMRRHTEIGQTSRERLAWMACYLSDRQISVRLGRPFACRGLQPAILSGQQGSPIVDSQGGGRDDFTSVFRARLELTQIFTNVHEILYCGMDNGSNLIVLGNYTTYLDDFRAAIAAWHTVWGSLTCSRNVKVLLQMSYEYLRLYTNAFAFQAAAHRPSSTTLRSSISIHGIGGTGSLPEARFMYEAVDAAKSLLTILNNYIPPGESIHCFPVRFPLYCVNAAVFLYKTWTTNLLSIPEKSCVRPLITDTISRLRNGAVRPTGLGPRYAHILDVLWKRTDRAERGRDLSPPTFGEAPHQQPSFSDRNPSLNNEFSWLDLEAIGDFVWGDTSRLDELDFTSTQAPPDVRFAADYFNEMPSHSGNDVMRRF
ncbi:hypothetical protein BJX62DRAFT_219637 [Aspergillus germanicus]